VVVTNVVVDVLLGAGVVGEALCVVGVVLLRTTFDRLHFAGAATTVPAFFVLAAVLAREHLSAGGLEAIAAVAILFLLNPVLVHATARAVRRAELGDVTPLPEERVASGR
jgi:multisubunit Na+/H+ antiporter MnhG subunit